MLCCCRGVPAGLQARHYGVSAGEHVPALHLHTWRLQVPRSVTDSMSAVAVFAATAISNCPLRLLAFMALFTRSGAMLGPLCSLRTLAHFWPGMAVCILFCMHFCQCTNVPPAAAPLCCVQATHASLLLAPMVLSCITAMPQHPMTDRCAELGAVDAHVPPAYIYMVAWHTTNTPSSLSAFHKLSLCLLHQCLVWWSVRVPQLVSKQCHCSGRTYSRPVAIP